MGMHEKIDVPAVPAGPPAPIAKSVLAHRKKLEAERDALRTGAALLAFKSSQGDTAAREALAAIPARHAALTLEIDLNHDAHQLAMEQDSAAEAAYRAGLQLLSPDELIEGIGKDSCCRRCQPGAFCVITAGYPFAGAQCGHPIKEKIQVFGRDETGTRRFVYDQNPQALKVFTAARHRLKVDER